jgi:membrane-bound lytic murein transglycosylase A
MLRFGLIFTLIALTSCFFTSKSTITGKGDIKLIQVDYSDLDSWEKDNHKEALQAFIHSCNKFSKRAQKRLIGGQIGNITAGDFRDVCEIAQVVKTMSNAQAQNFFENWFRPFLVENRSGKQRGLFTGYYEASLNGSRVKTERFKYPIYSKPDDLTGEVYFSREEIENGALEGKNLEIIYVDDKVDLFFMHIQGSGRVKLPNGSSVRIGYAGRNNLPFTAVSNHMADKGYLERSNLNAATVREWLKNNPEKADEVMNVNTLFIFFKIIKGEYVVGGQGVPLTPERSLAVDRSLIPYGLPIWIQTDLKKKDKSRTKYSRLFVAQDTGSAITGSTRGDVFFGHGPAAEEKAFYMASMGSYYILLPSNIVDKLSK